MFVHPLAGIPLSELPANITASLMKINGAQPNVLANLSPKTVSQVFRYFSLTAALEKKSDLWEITFGCKTMGMQAAPFRLGRSSNAAGAGCAGRYSTRLRCAALAVEGKPEGRLCWAWARFSGWPNSASARRFGAAFRSSPPAKWKTWSSQLRRFLRLHCNFLR